MSFLGKRWVPYLNFPLKLDSFWVGQRHRNTFTVDVFCEGCKGITWRIIPSSNWLGSPPCINHKFRPFGRGTTPTRSLGDIQTIIMVINHVMGPVMGVVILQAAGRTSFVTGRYSTPAEAETAEPWIDFDAKLGETSKPRSFALGIF